MKFFFNILSIWAIYSSFGAFKAVGNELDEVICNAMKGMQAQEEKKIPYNIGDYELIGITVDCKKKALITEKKHMQYSLSDFSEDFKINATKNWENANCKNMIFNTNFILSYLSKFMSLQPGDLITTGTPAGVGMGMKPQVFLKSGDNIKLSIDFLGEQNSKVVIK